MSTSPETARAMEVLFYAQCQLAGMQAENQQRAHLGQSMAYTEDSFLVLAEQTRGLFRNALEGYYPISHT
jgi:hypothetical protein